jgi:hypothetical protein
VSDELDPEGVEAAAYAIWCDLGGNERDWRNATHTAVSIYLSNARAAITAYQRATTIQDSYACAECRVLLDGQPHHPRCSFAAPSPPDKGRPE